MAIKPTYPEIRAYLQAALEKVEHDKTAKNLEEIIRIVIDCPTFIADWAAERREA